MASVTCHGSLAVDFKMRLQKRILNIQRHIQTCGGSNADRESVGGWCGRGPNWTGSSSSMGSSARLSHSLRSQSSALSIGTEGGGQAGETPPSRGKVPRARMIRRASTTTTRILTLSSTGGKHGKHGSVNEIQLGPEVAVAATDEGAAAAESAETGVSPNRASSNRASPNRASPARRKMSNSAAPEHSRGWRFQFDRASTSCLDVQGGGRQASCASCEPLLHHSSSAVGEMGKVADAADAESGK